MSVLVIIAISFSLAVIGSELSESYESTEKLSPPLLQTIFSIMPTPPYEITAMLTVIAILGVFLHVKVSLFAACAVQRISHCVYAE